MLKKNVTILTALALVALAVPALAGPIGDYDDTFVEDSDSGLAVSSYGVDTEEYSWFSYEAPESDSGENPTATSVAGVECRDTDDTSVAYFGHLQD